MGTWILVKIIGSALDGAYHLPPKEYSGVVELISTGIIRRLRLASMTGASVIPRPNNNARVQLLSMFSRLG